MFSAGPTSQNLTKGFLFVFSFISLSFFFFFLNFLYFFFNFYHFLSNFLLFFHFFLLLGQKFLCPLVKFMFFSNQENLWDGLLFVIHFWPLVAQAETLLFILLVHIIKDDSVSGVHGKYKIKVRSCYQWYS